MARAMLWVGAGITLAFVLIALLAPVLAPYDFDTFQADGQRFPQLAAPSSRPPDGHERPVDGRALADHLGHPDGAQGRDRVALLLDRDRRSARAPLRLLRRQARPRARADHGRAVRVPVPAARDRDRVPARRQGRPGDPDARRSRSRSCTCLSTSASSATTRSRSGRSRSSRQRGHWARSPFTVIRKYVFFNVVQNVPPLATLNAADAILTLAALGFLGYGIQPTAGCGVGLRHQPGGLRRRVRHLVDGSLPGARDRAARHRPHAPRRGARTRRQSGAAEAARTSRSTSSRAPSRARSRL